MYEQLRALKTEIEHIQHLHEKAKLQIQRNFEQWWNHQVEKKEVGMTILHSEYVLSTYVIVMVCFCVCVF